LDFEEYRLFIFKNMPTKFHVVIPCAGSGSRASLNGPKQYAWLIDAPLVIHTLRAFQGISGLCHGVVVVSPDDLEMEAILQSHPQNKFRISRTGGKTRAESVRAGLHALAQSEIDGNDWVLVHDAARCMITSDLIEKLINFCQDDDVGGLLALPLPDTLKSETHGRVSQTLPRQEKWLAQTPQMFRWRLLDAALHQGSSTVTDEASAVEALGLSPMLIKGAAFNFKVTYAEDMEMAEALMRFRQQPKVVS
jgi:2-C-methyl-D-erythritol 4-phosphate cytidylyltransferase